MHLEQALRSADRRVRVAALDTLVERATTGDADAVQALRGIVTGYRGFDPVVDGPGMRRPGDHRG